MSVEFQVDCLCGWSIILRASGDGDIAADRQVQMENSARRMHERLGGCPLTPSADQRQPVPKRDETPDS